MPTYDLSDRLRVFAKLDTTKLSDEFKQKLAHEEGSYELVDIDIPRDWPYTEEIMASRIGAALVDEDGTILAEYPGETGWRKALEARSNAKMNFDISLGGEVEEEEVVSEAEDGAPTLSALSKADPDRVAAITAETRAAWLAK